MRRIRRTDFSVIIGAACTHYPGAEVSILVPWARTVVVSATVGVGINHTFGVNDEARIVVASSATDCTLDNYTAFVSDPGSLPTDPHHFATVPCCAHSCCRDPPW